ncbi:hypothetical protein DID88_004321 [Monilinia fructigena]|uniref:Enoyl reductase (ER) domain-containing protein n=1 Tax=Monilinia fructigena TaxID=38457 RepID=A0A395IUZ6_9HELO|nr:hypothetical protein DID88_004321 [Monilinia fructigena]
MAFEGVPEKMLAAQVVEFKKPYKIHHIPTPRGPLHEHDMLIRVAAASLCHTDSMVSAGIMGTPLPCTASHEGAGTIVAVGSSVSGFKPGDRILCSLIYHRCGVSDVKTYEKLGGGLVIWEYSSLKRFGLNVVAVDARDEAIQLAKDCGADVLVDARQSKTKVVEEVQRVTGGQGAHSTLNISDHESAAATAVAITRRHGTMVQIAQPENISVPFADLIFRDIRIHGSLVGSRGEAQKMLRISIKAQHQSSNKPIQRPGRNPQGCRACILGQNEGQTCYRN